MNTKWHDELRALIYFVATATGAVGAVLVVVPVARAIEIGVVLMVVSAAAFQAARRIKPKTVESEKT